MKILKVICLVAVLLPGFAQAGEVWKWNTKVEKIKLFAGSSNKMCFVVTGVDHNLCLDLSNPGSQEKYSLLLSAKMAQQKLSVSYRDDQSIPGLWFSNYLAAHIWLED